MNRDNLHSENRPKGSACESSDTLDHEGETVAPDQRQSSDDSDQGPDEAARSPLEDAGAPGGTSGTGGTNHDQDR